MNENPFEPRLGRIRSGGRIGRGRTLMSKVARAASRAGPLRTGRRVGAKRNGRQNYSRRVIVKARFVRASMSSRKALAQHLQYISRDAATREADRGRLFDATSDDVDKEHFSDAATDDRHHFRLIVSPEDGAELADMKPFIRDLTARMEKDLGTSLNWVAAIHDNTDHPHAHIVVRGRRDDGRDLVMPRAYISHGIRERAEELVTLELGPQSQLEKDKKLARQVNAERLTEIDRSLARLCNKDGELNLMHAPLRYRSINSARLNKLAALGLARQAATDRWQLAGGFQTTLKELGERGDIIKQIHRALREKSGRVVAPQDFAFEEFGGSVTGAILHIGMMGEGHDQPYLILDALDGRATFARVNEHFLSDDLARGMVVTIKPIERGPKPSDTTISKIAMMNSGQYSEAIHRRADPSAIPGYISAHIRRLEALRRRGIVERKSDGSWLIPDDYLQQVSRYQKRAASKSGASLSVDSWADLNAQIKAPGLTWLDRSPKSRKLGPGFGEDVRLAMDARREELARRGLLSSSDHVLTRDVLITLDREGLKTIGEQLAAEFGKPNVPVRIHDELDGIYRKTLLRPEGKFAVIDRQRSIALVPWRKEMDRARGQFISGTVGRSGISWKLGRTRGCSIS